MRVRGNDTETQQVIRENSKEFMLIWFLRIYYKGKPHTWELQNIQSRIEI